MKGLTVVSSIYRYCITDRYDILFRMLEETYGFPVQYTDEPEIPADTDIVFVALQRTYNGSMMNLEHLDRKIKMIGLLGDIHSLDLFEGNGRKMLHRYDVILSGVQEDFIRLYPEFVNKFVFFPVFFSPHKRYVDLAFNENPKLRCLLAGAISPENLYPLRSFVAKKGDPKTTDRLPYPGHHPRRNEVKMLPRFAIGDRFAHLLNHYLCALTATHAEGGEVEDDHYPAVKTVIPKCVEIPAAGALLLTDRCKDLDDLGFVPHEHYVPVTKDDVLDQINTIVTNPEKYLLMRLAGMEMVRERHSIENRFEDFERILETRL